MKKHILSLLFALTALCGCSTTVPTPFDTALVMHSSLNELKSLYRDLISVRTAGYSENNEEIPLVIIGDELAPKKVLITASIHAREYLSTHVLLKLAAFYLEDLKKDGSGKYSDTVFYLLPLLNPDGVKICQKGREYQPQALKDRAFLEGFEKDDLLKWKANLHGVDLNRNFETGFDTVNLKGVDGPSASMWKGDRPLSERESRLLHKVALSYDFNLCINLHQQGEVVYYGSALAEDYVNLLSRALALHIIEHNGYRLDDSNVKNDTPSYGTFADFVCTALKIPSVTIELDIGLPPDTFGNIDELANKHRSLFITAADFIK